MDGTGDRVDRAPATDPPAGSARPGTLTERRRWATEMEIAETAARLFTERGTAAVTAAGIADAAGVGLRTFYRYFPGKEDAIAPLLSAGADDWRAALHAVDRSVGLDDAVELAIAGTLRPPEGDEGRRRADWTRDLLRAAEGDAALADVWYRVNRTSEQLLRPILAERVGVAADAFSLRLIAAAATDAIRVGLEAWAQTDAAFDGPDGPSALAVGAYRFLRGGTPSTARGPDLDT